MIYKKHFLLFALTVFFLHLFLLTKSNLFFTGDRQ